MVGGGLQEFWGGAVTGAGGEAAELGDRGFISAKVGEVVGLVHLCLELSGELFALLFDTADVGIGLGYDLLQGC